MEVGIFMALSSQALDVADLARQSEAVGFESLWLPEHPIMPVHSSSRYHGTPDGSIPEYMADMVDPYMALARAAAVTHTLKLGTSISLIPERNPLLTAKIIATLDLHSGGRFILGVGAGWLREETEIMGGDFDHRWSQTREAILAMKVLWTKAEAEFHGKYFDFPPVKCYPQPVQKPHPPIFLGGNARNVFRRVAGWADGWLPAGPTVEQVKAGRAALDERAVAAGRDPASIQITAFAVPADRERLQDYAAAGANRAIVMLPDSKDPAALAELERIGKAVL